MPKFAESWLAVEGAIGARPVLTGTAHEMRAQLDGLLQALEPQYPPLPDTVDAKDVSIGPSLTIRIYTAKVAPESGLLPVGIYAHGGGWVLGDVDTEDRLCRVIAEHTYTVIVSVGYRLAPEHKWPAQTEDIAATIKWVLANASSIRADSKSLFTIGVSAGGGLALASARISSLGEAGIPAGAVKGVIALAPVTLHPDHVPEAYRKDFASYEEFKEGSPIIDQSSMRSFFAEAAVRPEDKTAFVALDTPALRRFPPAYICTCEIDPLRDDGKILACELETAGVPVKADHYPGLPHCFWIFPSVPEGQDFVANTIQGIKWVLQKAHPSLSVNVM